MSRPANVMIDLETLDSKPGALILAIGACEVLPPDQMDNAQTFYVKFDSDKAELFTISKETVKWWMQFPNKFLELTSNGDTYDLQLENPRVAISRFSSWVQRKIANSWNVPLSDSDVLVWGDGADFDIIVLEEAMRRLNIDIPWTYRSHRCYRTLRSILNIGEKKDYISPEDLHNAEKDAMGQARHLSVLLDHLGYWKEDGEEKNNRSD